MSEDGTAPGGSTITLSTGARIPRLGLGVWQVADGPACEQAVRWALDCGYRLIDTAQAYGNEASVGRAIRASGVPREEIFLTTKFRPGRRDPRAEAVRSLQRLDTDYVDLYLVHWPQGGARRAWPGMEAALTSGLARNVGVSNFGSAEIDELMKDWQAPPVVNQVELSPFENRGALIRKSESEGLTVQAYSPLGTGKHLADPTIRGIASELRRTPAQILIRWGIERGLSVVTKSTRRDRIRENSQVFDFELGESHVQAMESLDTTGHTGLALERRRAWWS